MTATIEFTTLGLSSRLQEVLKELGFRELTPIQARSIPPLLAGRDLIGQSRTGSGKTAAFALPILERIQLSKGPGVPPQALVLCPTRELCTQVAGEVRRLGRRHPGLHVLTLSGGQPIFPQLTALEKGVHVAVGTPGRVLDHLQRRTLDLSGVLTVVLDEADRMLDMGFQDDMERILNAAPKGRQTIFFSATFPRSIEAMSRLYQRDPVKVEITEGLEAPVDGSQASPAIRQVVYPAEPDERVGALLRLLHEAAPESALVFCNFKASVAGLTDALREAGVSVACLHGDLEQNERDRVMAKFRNHSTRVLVATDVAARGIDVASLDVVYNFELPQQPEVYVHRIGRTGRAGKGGLAVAFASARESRKLEEIERATGANLIREPGVRAFAGGEFPEAAMETLYISGGRKDKVRPGDILGALTGEAGGLEASRIGKIEIHDRFSYVAVSREVARAALESLRNGRIKGRKFVIEKVR